MSRTVKVPPPNPYRKEDKKHRHQTHVKYRSKVKTRMAHDDFDNILPFKGTSGWETW